MTPARPQPSNDDQTIELRDRIVRSVSRVPIITGSVTVAGLTQITCEHIGGEIVALGFGNQAAANSQITIEGPPADLLALLVRAIGAVKRKNLDLGLPRLLDTGFDQIDPADTDTPDH